MDLWKKLIITGICFLAAGCYYDTQEALYKSLDQNAVCDTTNITYTGRISLIIHANCGACHSGLTADDQGTINLEDFSVLQGQVTNGKLISDINQGSGSNPMPKSGNKLSRCDIAAIQHWIDLGSKKN